MREPKEDKRVGCKIGTQPWLVYLHGSDARRMAVGKRVRVRRHINAEWQHVLVTRVDPDGYFMADQ